MNIYRFIDSRDIREHLENLNYSFTAPEAAFLVYRCRTATLKEKFAAWNEIINTMPNCSMDKRSNMEAIPDFHQFLRDYMDLQTRMLRRFKEPNGNYICEVRTQNKPCHKWTLGVFDTFEQCSTEIFTVVLRHLKGCADLRVYKYPKSTNTKGNPDQTAFCTLTPQGELCSLKLSTDNDRDYDLSVSFDGMWFDFPTPFHGGDIVCSRSNPENPFVLSKICTWNASKLKQEVFLPEIPEEYAANKEEYFAHLENKTAELRAKGSSNDMSCCGYYLDFWLDDINTTPDICHGELSYFDYHEYECCPYNYLDLEYFRKPLTGFFRTLEPISFFLKKSGSPGLEWLLKSYGRNQLTAVSKLKNINIF